MIIDSMIPGQEEGNAELITNLGAGLIARDPQKLEETILHIIKKDGAKWLSLREAAKKNSQKNTALKVAKFVTS